MNQHIEMELDDRGRLLLPPAVVQHLGLHLGMTLVVEQESAGMSYLRIQRDEPRIVNRQGVLVVEAEAEGDVEWAVQHERERRFDILLTRMGSCKCSSTTRIWCQ